MVTSPKRAQTSANQRLKGLKLGKDLAKKYKVDLRILPVGVQLNCLIHRQSFSNIFSSVQGSREHNEIQGHNIITLTRNNTELTRVLPEVRTVRSKCSEEID